MNRRRRLSPEQREELWEAEAAKAKADNRGDCPICNICDMPVVRGHLWHDSHVGAPHALGGTVTGVAHRRCNLEHGAKVVTPMVAKAKRQFRRDAGITGPGLGRSPMPGGRDDPRKRKIGQRWPVDRRTQEPWRFS